MVQNKMYIRKIQTYSLDSSNVIKNVQNIIIKHQLLTFLSRESHHRNLLIWSVHHPVCTHFVYWGFIYFEVFGLAQNLKQDAVVTFLQQAFPKFELNKTS